MEKLIEKAIEAEKQYIKARLSGENVILDLSEFGYSNIDKYFNDKREYLISNCGIVVYDTTMEDIENRVENAVKMKTPSLWIPTADEVFVWHGNEPIDEELCADLGVRIYNMNYIGGTIVSGPEDLSFAVIIPETIDVGTSYMLEKIKDIMSKYIDDVVVDGNDILVGGTKVLGSMNRRVNGVYVFACQISYADRTEYIKQLCSKQSVKTPDFINSAKLPKQTLKNEVIAWL